jgi:hypothetical protein
MQQGGFLADYSCYRRLTIDLSFLFIPNPDIELNFLIFPCLLVRLHAPLSLKKEDVMKKSGLILFLVLLLSCPLMAQEKTIDPGLVQPALGSLNCQRYGPEGYGSEAEGHWSAESLNYQRYGPEGYGSEAEGYWPAESDFH